MHGVGGCRYMGVLILALGLSCDTSAPNEAVPIAGEHRFRVGDSNRFASADFDDSRWETIDMPAVWRVKTVGAEVFGWHRIRFNLPEALAEEKLAVDIGAIAWSDEAFLNGRTIGATGRLNGLPRLGIRSRLYEIPQGLVRPGTNVLAIRVRGIPFGVNGLLGRRILLGRATDLYRARVRTRAAIELIEGLLLGLMAFAWIVLVFASKRGRRGRATFYLLGSLSLGIVVLWLLGATWRLNGFSPEAGANHVLGLVCLAAALHWGFVASIARGVIPPRIRGLMVAQAAIGGVLLVWADAFAVLLAIAVPVGLITLAALSWLLVAAIRARVAGAIAIAVGMVFGGLGVVAMAALPHPFVAGQPLLIFGFVASSGFAVLAVTQHHSELNRRAERATAYSLEAHQRERNRLARDLHDGLGQMLALLKLQMQRMAGKHKGEPIQELFDESAQQVAATIDELRRVARDLRPTPLEERGFSEAVREYAAAIAQRTDLAVEVEGDFRRELRDDIGAELYRITQECLTNCIKHSGARHVRVELSETDDSCRLRVIDDGRGLVDERADGLGLETIRERSEIVGGRCEISPAPGGGTCVEVAVPR